MQLRLLISAVTCVLFSASGLAAEQTKTLATMPSSPAYLIKLVLALVAVLLLFSAIAWLVRRFGLSGLGGLGSPSSGRLKITDSLSLGSRERLVIVQAGEQQLLLGITPGQINKLHLMSSDPHTENSFRDQLSKQQKQT